MSVIVVNCVDKFFPSEEQQEEFAVSVTESLVELFKIDAQRVKVHFRSAQDLKPLEVQIIFVDHGGDLNAQAIKAITTAANKMRVYPYFDIVILKKENTWFGGKQKD